MVYSRKISVLVTLFLSFSFLLLLTSQSKADSDLFKKACSLIQSGIDHASATEDYITQKINKGELTPAALTAFNICNKWYGGIYGSFTTALSYVQDKKFELARNSVDSVVNFANNCEQEFVSVGVQDVQISNSDSLVMGISKSAGKVIDSLGQESSQPPAV